MSDIANVTRLLLSDIDYNRTLGAQVAKGLGLAEQILAHYKREIMLRLGVKSSLAHMVTADFSYAKINKAIWALSSALEIPIYL